jgi:hypothetical protein
MLHTVLLVIAIVCFGVKAVGVQSRVDFWPLGWAFVIASLLV